MVSERGDWPDRAIELMVAMSRRMAGQLRQLAPKPMGLVNREAGLPAFVGSHTQGGSAEGVGDIRQRGTPPPISSMTLCYGTPEDPRSPYISVFTDFTPGHDDSVSLRYALGEAISSEQARLAGKLENHVPGKPPRGPLERGELQIIVAGQLRTVRTQAYQGFHGLQFSRAGLLVRVIARRSWPDRPEFAIITDLEPYLAQMESPDSEVIRARLLARYPDGPPHRPS